VFSIHSAASIRSLALMVDFPTMQSSLHHSPSLITQRCACIMPHCPAPSPINEEERALSLEHLGILDTPHEEGFDDIVMLASLWCDAPIALVSLVDRKRQWFKACVGLDAQETHRDLAFCAHAILVPEDVLVIDDALLDERFKENPLVLGPPYIRFYAGAPIRDDAGHALGTVCVIDTKPRPLSDPQRISLLALARQTSALLQLSLLSNQQEIRAQSLENDLVQATVLNRQAENSRDHAKLVSSIGMVAVSIAHDFNNLLQALSASLQMIKLRARRPADVERLSDTGLEAVEQGSQLVTYLLSSVRQDTPNLACVDINSRLASIHDVLTRTATDNVDVALKLTAPATGVLCDESQLNAAVLNLVTNARDALAGAGKITIATQLLSVEDHAVLASGDYVVLSVSDNGPGIPAEIAQNIFEPFFTTKDQAKGTGLGLSQVRDFAEATGGMVQAHTSLGTGTKIELYLRALGRISDLQISA
jgi:signal transduction histidine kinase